MALTDAQIKTAKPRDKAYKLPRENGLFALVNPNGSKWWRLSYTFEGKEKLVSLGVYPTVTLKMARERRDEAKRQIEQGIDPSKHRQMTKADRLSAGKDTFNAVALEWLTKFGPTWSEGHGERIKRRFEANIFPWLGKEPVGKITAPQLLAVIRRIESRGALDTAHRALRNCGQVFRYAVATGRAERDPSSDLRGALPPVKPKHHASITDPQAVADLLRSLQEYRGTFATQCALRLSPLLFVRPGELRHAEWVEFDLDAAEWRIPGEKMKSGALHIVPLSKQAVAILKELEPLTGTKKYVFPCVRSKDRPMSENTVNAALRRLGYSKDEMTGHGFRSLASTRLNEMGWNRDAIERQLAHGERDHVRAAYNYAEHLPERRSMMQAWADYLDGLARGTVVTGAFQRSA